MLFIWGDNLGTFKAFENMIENKLLGLHTAYLAKVLSTNGKTAKIQPLGYTKAYGEAAQKQSPLSNVPIATQKIVNKSFTVISGVTADVDKNDEKLVTNVGLKTTTKEITIPQIEEISAGDIVVCICCERDITEARKGNNATPVVGHHSMSDSIIIACL